MEFLKSGIRDTYQQGDWTQRNFELLRDFVRTLRIDAECDPSAKNAPSGQKAKQFLWDFIAFKPKVKLYWPLSQSTVQISSTPSLRTSKNSSMCGRR